MDLGIINKLRRDRFMFFKIGVPDLKKIKIKIPPQKEDGCDYYKKQDRL